MKSSNEIQSCMKTALCVIPTHITDIRHLAWVIPVLHDSYDPWKTLNGSPYPGGQSRYPDDLFLYTTRHSLGTINYSVFEVVAPFSWIIVTLKQDILTSPNVLNPIWKYQQTAAHTPKVAKFLFDYTEHLTNPPDKPRQFTVSGGPDWCLRFSRIGSRDVCVYRADVTNWGECRYPTLQGDEERAATPCRTDLLRLC